MAVAVVRRKGFLVRTRVAPFEPAARAHARAWYIAQRLPRDTPFVEAYAVSQAAQMRTEGFAFDPNPQLGEARAA